MKRARGLWPQVVSLQSLHTAATQVLRGKRGRANAGAFFFALEAQLFRLQRELTEQTYRPGAYRTFWIREPKVRLIAAAPFRDRVVHHALVNAIEPSFERRFIHHSYACRRGRGTHRALAQFKHWARASRYVLKLDIRKFFPSIDHAVMRERLRRGVKDPEVLWLCDRILDSADSDETVAWFPGDELLTPLVRRRGLPIGNLTSQFFANVLLDSLDHFALEELRVHRYLRYVDDFCVFSDDKIYLRDTRQALVEHLASLRLRLNEGKSRIRQPKEGIEFLGFVLTPNRLRLSKTGVRRQRRRVHRLRAQYAAGRIGPEQVRASLTAWNAHAAFGDTWHHRARVMNAAVCVSEGISNSDASIGSQLGRAP